MYREWVGQTFAVEDEIRPFPLAALAASLDRPAPDEEVPSLWHWTHFLVPKPRAMLGIDGHPQRGEFMPPIGLPRRMWAGGTVVFHSPLRLGDRAKRRSTIQSIDCKEGTTGPLVFVKVLHRIERGDKLIIEEVQDVVYRSSGPGAAQPAPVWAPANAPSVRDFVADSVLLFRYSALTFNSHRIHFDEDYARTAEGYSGLVVQGPLVATLLAGLADEAAGKIRIRKFSYRARAPLFAGERFLLHCKPTEEPDRLELWAERNGTMAMSASAAVGVS